MREIKFRAWNKEKKIMVYKNEDGSSCFWDGVIASSVELINCELNSEINRSEYEFMQYTGLEDKNGVEIYEGDILKIPEWLWEDEQEYCVCIYQQENEVCDVYGFGLYIKDGYSGKYKVRVPSDEWDEFEVVGNIYDNPELIEKESK